MNAAGADLTRTRDGGTRSESVVTRVLRGVIDLLVRYRKVVILYLADHPNHRPLSHVLHHALARIPPIQPHQMSA